MFFEMVKAGTWKNQRQSNLLDGGAPFYGVYRTADDKFVSFGALEPKFFAELVERLELPDVDMARQNDPETWPSMREKITAAVAKRTRDEWTAKLEQTAIYLVHRSFSWLIVIGTVGFLLLGSRHLEGGLGWLEKSIGGLVGALLVMGIVLAHVGVLRVVQVLHVGAAALLVAALFLWLLATRPLRE